jgi:hypothetical protein
MAGRFARSITGEFIRSYPELDRSVGCNRLFSCRLRFAQQANIDLNSEARDSEATFTFPDQIALLPNYDPGADMVCVEGLISCRGATSGTVGVWVTWPRTASATLMPE